MVTALGSAVSGLKAHQTKMDIIGNNIANVNTVGYKSQTTNFETLLYQTYQNASGPSETRGGVNPKQIGLGVKVGAISTSMTQGSAQNTGNSLDMMINGDNFFVVNNGSENLFTRDGSFTIDSLGNLCMSSTGFNVMGWGVDENGNVIQGIVSKLQVTSPENENSTPEATSKVQFTGLFDKNDENINNDGKNISLNFYDNLGYKYTANFVAKKNGNGFDLSLASIKDNKGVDVTGDTKFANGTDTMTLTFDEESGKIDDACKNFDLVLDTNTNAAFSSLNIDASSLVMYDNDGQSTLSFKRGDEDGIGAGKANGAIQGIAVSNNGKIFVSYDNGTSKCVGEIATARFTNPEGLSKQGDNLYSTTLNSGDFDGVGVDVTANGGYISTGELEMSNVDLSHEFTEMIVAQRGYQANARIISVVDSMLEEAVNLKR